MHIQGMTPSQLIRSLKPGGGFVTIFKIQPSGALQVRRAKNGQVRFFWRYTFECRSERIPIGPYGANVAPRSLAPVRGEFSVAAAERAAQDLALQHESAKATEGGLRGKREREEMARKEAEVQQRREAERQEAQRLEAEAVEKRRANFTLRALCEKYVEHLKTQDRRSSAYDAANIFSNHLYRNAEIAALPAAEVAVEQLTDLLRSLNEKGKGRTANKLRSYLGSAYSHALRAPFDPSIPVAFKEFQVRSNPVSSTFRIKGADTEDKNPLSLTELRQYWRALQAVPGVRGAALRLHVNSGGQRIAQLLRLRRFDDFGDRVRLLDSKGKRTCAREHFVPVTELARVDLDALKKVNKGEFLFSTDGGVTSLHPMTLTRWAAEIASAEGISNFAAKRVRSGIETLLASRRVSRDIRAQLQSHGLGGVQQRHYDAHDYHEEKREALCVLERALSETALPKVVSIAEFKAAA